VVIQEEALIDDNIVQTDHDIAGTAQLDQQITLIFQAGRKGRCDMIGAACYHRGTRFETGE